MSYRCAQVITAITSALLLTGCTDTQSVPSAPTATPLPAAATPIPPTPLPSPTPRPLPPTPIPTPFRSELVLCAGPEPETLLDGTPSAELVRGALSAHPVTYQASYAAQPGILAALPNPADGTLVRNADGTLTVTLRYREGLVWSDGRPFTAEDAALGLRAPFNDRLPDPILLETTAIDDLTLEVVLAEDTGYPYVPDAPPLPSHRLWGDLERLRNDSYAWRFDPGMGAYLLQEWRNGEMILAANPASYDPPNIPVIRVRFFDDPDDALDELLAGQCDVLPMDNWDMPETASLRAIEVTGPMWAHLDFNMYPNADDRVPYLADVRVRQAVAYALTVPGLQNWLPATHWAAGAYAPSTPYSYSPDRIASLLEEAGWVDTDHDLVREYTGAGGVDACDREWRIEEGTPLRLQMIVPREDERRLDIAHQIAADLRIVGIPVALMEIPTDVFFSRAGPLVRREFDLALYSWATLPEPDGVSRWLGEDIYLHPLDLDPVHLWELPEPTDEADPPPQLATQVIAANNIPSPANDYQGQNFPGWCNPEANLALVNANWSLDVAERQAYYAVHLTRFAEDLPTIPLFWYTQVVPAQRYVCGIQPNAANGLTWNLADWFFDRSGDCGGT